MTNKALGNKIYRIFLFASMLILAALIGCKDDSPTQPDTGNTTGQAVLLTSLTATPSTIGIGGSSRIAALVIDENAAPLAGRVVSFRANDGVITPFDTTNAAGVAEAIFRGPSTLGVTRVYAEIGDQIDSIAVTTDDAVSQNLLVVPEVGTIYANGFSTDILTIAVWDNEQQPVEGVRVALETSAGSMTSFVITNSNGLASAEIRSEASETDIAATIRASVDEVETYTLVIFSGVTFSLEANPTFLIADGGNSTSTVRAILKETTSKIAIPKAEIRFGADLGTIPNIIETDPSGVAETTLKSSIQTGNSMIIASYGQFIQDTVHVMMGQSVPTYLTLTSSKTELIADARSAAQLKAVVTDGSANPVPDGTVVQFAFVEGTGTLETQTTTVNGIAVSNLTSSRTPGTVRIAAAVNALADTVNLRYIVGPATTVTLESDSSSLPADGRTTTIIRATVVDEVGNPVPDGSLVRFDATFGDVTATAETVNGVATVTYSSTETGLAEITASIDEISRTITVRMRPGGANSILLTYDPTSLGVRDKVGS